MGRFSDRLFCDRMVAGDDGGNAMIARISIWVSAIVWTAILIFCDPKGELPSISANIFIAAALLAESIKDNRP